MSNKKIFKVTLDGKEVELAVKKPDLQTQRKGQFIYSREVCRLVRSEDGESGALVRPALDKVMRQQGLWDDDKQKRWDELNQRLLNNEKKLKQGQKSGLKTLSAAKEVAIQMRRDRYELRQLLMDRQQLDANTAEGQAENTRFNYFVANSTVYNDTGKPVFKNEEDYLSRAGEPMAQEAARHFGQLYYGLDDDFEKGLPENQFLLSKKLVRESDLHLVDKDGNLVDAIGRRVNEKGYLVNEKGEPIDQDGDPLTEDGEYKIEGFVDFEDDIHTFAADGGCGGQNAEEATEVAGKTEASELVSV